MKNIGIAKCSNCNEEKECIQFWDRWHSVCQICESCLSKALRMCTKDNKPKNEQETPKEDESNLEDFVG